MAQKLRVSKKVRTIFISIAVIAVSIRPMIDIYTWVAWEFLTKEFEAVCTEYSALTGGSDDRLRVVDGPYTQEFWQVLRDQYSPSTYYRMPELVLSEVDVTFRVPLAFDFVADEEEIFLGIRHSDRPRERSYIMSRAAALTILDAREAEGVDLHPFEALAFTTDKELYPPSLHANTCGIMHELITVGGALAREDTATGERP